LRSIAVVAESLTLVTRLSEPVAPDQPDLFDESPVVDV
jgi:hypothetical protein